MIAIEYSPMCANAKLRTRTAALIAMLAAVPGLPACSSAQHRHVRTRDGAVTGVIWRAGGPGPSAHTLIVPGTVIVSGPSGRVVKRERLRRPNPRFRFELRPGRYYLRVVRSCGCPAKVVHLRPGRTTEIVVSTDCTIM